MDVFFTLILCCQWPPQQVRELVGTPRPLGETLCTPGGLLTVCSIKRQQKQHKQDSRPHVGAQAAPPGPSGEALAQVRLPRLSARTQKMEGCEGRATLGREVIETRGRDMCLQDTGSIHTRYSAAAL